MIFAKFRLFGVGEKMKAIITARGGSKRIPRKNIKDFLGYPMISYAINAALKSGIFDEVMVSTDDKQIAEVAKKYGASVPFLRSAKNSDDFATTKDVLDEVIAEYEKMGVRFDEFACIYPCVPLLNADTLKKAYDEFKKCDYDCLVPVVRFSFPIQRAFKINDSGFLEYNEPKYANTRSQDLEPMYHDCGMFYFYKTKPYLANDMKVGAFVMDERVVQDIDNEEDWQMAELKYKVIYG